MDQMEAQEHDGEHQEHIVHLVKIMGKPLDRSSETLEACYETPLGKHRPPGWNNVLDFV